jgi:FtsH-binding integral membrane protein
MVFGGQSPDPFFKFGHCPLNHFFICSLWPQYVKERIQNTYAYFGGSVVLTAASAAAIFRSPTLFNLVSRSGWVSLCVTMAAMIGSSMVAHSIPYTPGVGTKQFAWATHCAIMVKHNLHINELFNN